MELRPCRKCKKIFQYAGGKPICPVCAREEELIFSEVKEYLLDNRGATLEQVSENTRATVAMIQGYIKEGRIEISTESPIALACEKCGKKIITGRYCKACSKSLADQLQGVADSLSASGNVKREHSGVTFLNKENYKG